MFEWLSRQWSRIKAVIKRKPRQKYFNPGVYVKETVQSYYPSLPSSIPVFANTISSKSINKSGPLSVPVGHLFYMDFRVLNIIDGPARQKRDILISIVVQVDYGTGKGTPLRAYIGKCPEKNLRSRGRIVAIVNLKQGYYKILKNLYLDFPTDYNFTADKIRGVDAIGDDIGIDITKYSSQSGQSSNKTRYTMTYGVLGSFYIITNPTTVEPYLEIKFEDKWQITQMN